MIPGVGHQQSLPLAAEGHGRGTVQLVQLLPPAPEEQLPLALAATPTQQPVVEGVGDQQGTAALEKCGQVKSWNLLKHQGNQWKSWGK